MSTTKDTGGFVHPHLERGANGLELSCTGMTLRDHFAGLAMQGELASMVDPEGATCAIELDAPDTTLARLAAHWYRIADAMLKERSK